VPSQKGFLEELPQRQSANAPRAGTSSPRESRSRHGPRTTYGPFFATSIAVLADGARALISADVGRAYRQGTDDARPAVPNHGSEKA